MLNSRKIDDLRPDVAKNCKAFISEMAKRGYTKVGVMTIRDDEYQYDCYVRGTGGKPPATFHSVHASLAFDVFKNVKGHAYDDPEFFRVAGEVGKMIGFTWGGDWRRPDRPHFQWDNHGAYSGRDIIRKNYPPTMPTYKEDKHMTVAEACKIVQEKAKLSDETIEYLYKDYKYGNELIIKLAEAMC